MTTDKTKLLPADKQDAYAELWNALGLPQGNQDNREAHDHSTDDTASEVAELSYQVLVRYQGNDRNHDGHVAQNRRRHPRYNVGNRCQFRIGGMPSYGQGLLHNISASGIAIGVHRKLALGREITVLIETGDSRQLPIIIHATILREAGVTHDGLYRYGCQIDRIRNPNE